MVKVLNWKRDALLIAFLLYPIVDYVLRLLPLPVLPSLWDEAVLVALFFVAAHRARRDDRRLPGFLTTPLYAFIALGVAMIGADLTNFGVTTEGFRAIFQYMIALYIGLHLFRTQAEANDALTLFAATAGIVAVYGLLQPLLGIETPMSWVDASEGQRIRIFSIVQSPNVLGSYMVLALPLTICLTVFAPSWARRIAFALCATALFAALVLTFSRGAQLAFFLSLILVGVLRDRRLLLAGLAIAVLVAVLVPSVTERFLHIFTPEYLEKSANDGRIARWLGAFDMMRLEPLFGLGPGHYGGAVGNRHFGTIYVDSYYFKTLAEMGLVGLGLWLWLLGALFFALHQTWRALAKGEARWLSISLFAGLLGMALHNGVENIFEVPFLNAYFWFLSGLTLALPHLARKEA